MDSYAPPGEASIRYSDAYAPIVCVGLQPDIIGGNNVQLVVSQNKRKEKARLAARARRSQESSIIMEMAEELLITQEKLRRIDKATIVRLAIDYIKAHEALCRISYLTTAADCGYVPAASYTPIVIERPLVLQHQQLPPIDDDNVGPVVVVVGRQLAASKSSSSRRKQQRDSTGNCHKQANKHQKIDNHEQTLASKENNCRREEMTQISRQQQQQQRQKLDESSEDYGPDQTSLPVPKSITSMIFAPKTSDNINANYLMIEDNGDGKTSFVLKPDTEISDEDDLTHLAPQAGDISISLCDSAPIDLMGQPTSVVSGGHSFEVHEVLEQMVAAEKPSATIITRQQQQQQLYSVATNDNIDPGQQQQQLKQLPMTQTMAMFETTRNITTNYPAGIYGGRQLCG